MKSRGLFVAFGAVGILAAITFWDYYRGEQIERSKEQSAKLFTVNIDQVNSIEIARKSDKVTLKRNVDGWNLTEPVQDVADNAEVENYLKDILEEKSLDVVKEGGEIPWAEYQLAPAYAKMTLTDASGKSETLELSEMTNYESRLYARRGSENRVITVGATFKSRSQDTNIRFRERKFYRGKLSSVKRVVLKLNGKETLDIEKTNAQEWTNKKDPVTKLDQNKVREILTQISETRVSNYLVNGPSQAEDRKKFGYGAAIGLLTMETADEKWTAEMSLSKQKDFMAVTSQPAFLLRMEPGQWEKYEKMNVVSLIDPTIYFGFEPTQVQSVVVTKNKKESIYKKKDGVWEDSKYIENLFKSLSGVNIKDVSSSSHLKTVEVSVKLRGIDDKVLFSLEQGTSDQGAKALKTSKAKNVIVPEVELAL